MEIQSVHVGPRRVSGKLNVVASRPVIPETAQPVTGLASIASTVTGGIVANTAWSGFQVSNAITPDQMTDLLVKNGLSDQFAPNATCEIIKLVKSEPTKVLLVAVSAGGTAWALIKAGSKFTGRKYSAKTKAAVSIAVAVIVGVAYYFLQRAGYVR